MLVFFSVWVLCGIVAVYLIARDSRTITVEGIVASIIILPGGSISLLVVGFAALASTDWSIKNPLYRGRK